MTRYHASWLVPIAGPPIPSAWVGIERGRIVEVGGGDRPAGSVDLGRVAILPGLVNAHTHLELSHLRDEVPPATSFVSWARSIIAARRRHLPRAPEILDGIERGVREAVALGTALVGDVSNTLASYDALVRSALGGVVFYEIIRFAAGDAQAIVNRACGEIAALPPAGSLRVSLAAHAPYSVAPAVFQAIRQAVDAVPAARTCVHLSESVEEVEFIGSGSGPWRATLEDLGAWDPGWTPPGVSPVEYLDAIGFLDPQVLVVHGVQMTPDDLARVALRGATLVTCPRSNGHTGAGAPPIQDFYRLGVRVAVGTDSLASAPDLNVFAELATMRALAPGVPARDLLASGTREGARALGFDAEYGTIEPGKRARLLAVSVPDGLDDVEEYLVTGVQPDQIRWIE